MKKNTREKSKNKAIRIYLAGRLFNAAERFHNLFLEKYLKERGLDVILPQREAVKRFGGEHFDTQGIAEDCFQNSKNQKLIFVGCLDGPDADPGTAVEYGIAIATTKRAVVYRTDFRTDVIKELGVNAMFRLRGTNFVYYPCFFTTLEEVDEYYRELARMIHFQILKLLKK